MKHAPANPSSKNRFRTRLTTLAAGVVILLISGCYVEERMAWSPDGSRAAVWTGGKLCLVNADGKLSPPLLTDVVSAAWLPDSHGLVVSRQLSVTEWNDIIRLVPRQETERIEALARGLPGLLKAALAAADNDPDAIEEKFFKPLKMEITPFLLAGVICLRDTQPATFKDVFARMKNFEQFEKKLSESGQSLVQEISVLRLEGNRLAGAPVIIQRTLDQLGKPLPSHKAAAVAFLRDDRLIVTSLTGRGSFAEVAERVAGGFDWMPDGRSLVFTVRLSSTWEQGTINLAHVQRRTVIDADGGIVEGDSQLLATGAFAFLPRVRCLPDGRVLFAGQPLDLPNTAESVAGARFYLVNPADGPKAAPKAISTPPGALPVDLAAFAPSPDGRRIAIAENGSDVVAVLEVATGRVEVISPTRGGQGRTLPAWHGNDELYFAALPKTGDRRPEWMRWHPGASPVVFSTGWSEGAVEGLVALPQQ